MQYAQHVEHGFHRKQPSLGGHRHDCPQQERAEQTDEDHEELGHLERPLVDDTITAQLDHSFCDAVLAKRRVAHEISESKQLAGGPAIRIDLSRKRCDPFIAVLSP
jgi:hypothetical protein